MESKPIKRVVIEALHGQHDLDIALHSGLNILYGRNGTGKTTFLHVLANLLDRDVGRFANMRFSSIGVETAEGTVIEVRQRRHGGNPSVAVRINGDEFEPISRGGETPLELRAELRRCLGGRPVYLPAFRSVLEAISRRRTHYSHITEEQKKGEYKQIVEREEEEFTEESRRHRYSYYYHEASRAVAYKTVLCREWFGPFVPIVRFPSLWEVSEELLSELQQAQLEVASTDREAFSGVFVDVLRSVISPTGTGPTGDVPSLLTSIGNNLADLQESQAGIPTVYHEIASMVKGQNPYPSREEAIATRILEVYDRALAERSSAQKRAFQRIETFEASVNRFLNGKELSVRNDDPRVYPRRATHARVIRLADGRTAGLSVLSSGERHVLTLLFSATHMTITDGLLLIDEPELSLHVGWQRIILDELMKQAGDRQIIACTHAPEVAAHHRQAMIELAPRATRHADLSGDDAMPDDLPLE